VRSGTYALWTGGGGGGEVRAARAKEEFLKADFGYLARGGGPAITCEWLRWVLRC